MSGMLPMPSMPMPAMPGAPVARRRMTPPERAALKLGQALIAWSNRPVRNVKPPREYNAHEYRERAAARAAREEQWARAMYFRHPWR